MVIFQNVYYNTYLDNYSDKKIIAYGIGGTFNIFLKMQTEKVELISAIDILVDADKNKNNKEIQVGTRSLKIQSISDLDKYKNLKEQYILILFLANDYVMKALEELDKVTALDGIICLYGLRAISWGWENQTPPFPTNPTLPKIKNNYTIPKIIHYCWFGENELSELNLKCVNSWKNVCSDYEVKLWNEKNVDIVNMPKYVLDAYKEKKYAFVSDYVRIDVVSRYGGFYLDTDVYLFRSLNELRSYKSVFAFMEYNEIATGLGFGSIARTKELEEMKSLYNKIPFFNADGTINLTPCPRYTNDYFRRKGVRINNSLQVVNDMIFLPSSYLSPLNAVECSDGSFNLSLFALEKHSIGIHLCENSWKSNDEREIFENKKKELYYINNRLLNDWKKY